jgi:hypothetical protein
MSPELSKWILGIAGAIIMLLLAGNGYWIKRLVASIDQLRQTVIDMEISAGTQKSEFSACKQRCESNSTTVNDRLKSYSTDIKIMGKQIATINAKLKIQPSHDEG